MRSNKTFPIAAPAALAALALAAFALAGPSASLYAQSTALPAEASKPHFDAAGSSPLEMPVAELIERAAALDGSRLTVQGEAIGSIMARGDMAWLNIEDSGGALGVWMRKEDASTVRYLGSYKATGDSLRVTGVFHRACPAHGGDLDLHAETLAVIAAGEPRTHKVSRVRVLFAATLSLLAAAAVAALLRKSARRRAEARRRSAAHS